MHSKGNPSFFCYRADKYNSNPSNLMMAAANPVITAPLQHLYPHPHHPIADKKAMKALPVGKIKHRDVSSSVYCANNIFLLI